MRPKVVLHRRHSAVSLWRGRKLLAGIGYMHVPGRLVHLFADFRDRSWMRDWLS